MIDLIGHRGYPALYPENTILSFKKAIENGCNGIEIDLRLTKDKKIAVIHDETLERTTNGKGKVRTFTLRELEKLDAGKGEKIPCLEEVLTTFNGVKLLLELKIYGTGTPELWNEAIKIVNKQKAKEKSTFVCFDLEIIKKIREAQPDIPTGLIFSRAWPPISTDELDLLPMHINALCPRKDRLDQTVAEYAKQNKLDLYVWTVDTEEELKKAKKYNITGVVSNDPREIKKFI